MNLIKRLLCSFSPSEEQGPLVRMDGNISGTAFLEGAVLARIEEAVKKISENRPYSYDLQFDGGKFNVIIVEEVLPKDMFDTDPEQAIVQDIENILSSLPHAERAGVQSTLRAVWQEGGEVNGVAFSVDKDGAVLSDRRFRPQEDYDRLTEKRAAVEYRAPTKKRIPVWATVFAILLAAVAGFFIYQHFGPHARLAALETAVKKAEMDGLEGLVKIRMLKAEPGGVEITISPESGFHEEYVRRLNADPAEADPADNPSDPLLRETNLERLAAEALLKGKLQLTIFDEQGLLLDVVPLDVSGFDGTGTVTIRTRPVRLYSSPSLVRIGP